MVDYAIVTACDKSRWHFAMNLLGSISKKSPGFKDIYIYDLGMTRAQRVLCRGIRGVHLKKVPPFTKYWRQGYSWKPWIWLNVPERKVIFLDAGTEVLRELDEICELIDRDGYFLVSQYETLKRGCTLGRITPVEYFEQFGIDERHRKDKVVAAGIIGYNTSSPLFTRVFPQVYQAVLEGYNLGWSEAEVWRNTGINRLPVPVVRKCEYFRHDQTLLNLFLYKDITTPNVQDVNKFGGFNGPHDHPQQLIWNSRANGHLGHFGDIDYRHTTRLRNAINKVYYQWRSSVMGTFYDRLIDKIRRTMGLIY